MKEIMITIDGKPLSKKEISIADWITLVEFTEQHKETSILTNKEAGLAVLRLVADYFGVPESKLQKEGNLAELMQAWRDINANVVEAFVGASNPKNAGGRPKQTAK